MHAATPLFDRILLVEDDASHAMLATRAIAPFCAEVVLARSLAEARTKLGALHPALVVTDLHLTDAAGAELIGELLALIAPAPLIVLTASTSLHDAVEAMKLGARDFLVKDFGPDFREIVGLSLRRIRDALAAEAEHARLQREMGVLRVAIENSGDGLAVSHSDGEIEYANAAFGSFAAACGGASDNLHNIFGAEVRGVQELTRALRERATTLPPGGVWHTEVELKSADLRAFDLSISIVPVGERREIVVWVRDVTEQKRREKFQREILSTTTHDLKGPLGAIIISAELMADLTKEVPKARELALRIGSSAHGAVNLIDEFLSARRIQEGTFVLRPAPHEVGALVDEMIQNFHTIAMARGITLNTVLEPGLPPVVTDRMGFIRAIGNLISNALKFTPKGGTVTLALAHRDGATRVRVTDTGSGIEPNEMKKLFQRYSRLSRHQEVSGSGLGLFVVRSVVSAHGGTIDVTSKVGEGSTFEVAFPDTPPVNERGEVIALEFA